MLLKVKSLTFNVLQKPLVFRVFAPEGESVRKYALIFRGRTGNSDRKSKSGYNLKAAHSVFVSTEYNILSVEESNAVSG